MAVAYKVAGNSMSYNRAGRLHPTGVSQQPEENPWEKWYAWYPKQINNKWYFREWIYRKWTLSPGGGFWQYGDDFDYLKWQK